MRTKATGHFDICEAFGLFFDKKFALFALIFALTQILGSGESKMLFLVTRFKLYPTFKFGDYSSTDVLGNHSKT